MFRLPLTQRVSFKTVLQKQNRLQVPKPVRWQHKLESSEVLRVTFVLLVCLAIVRVFC